MNIPWLLNRAEETEAKTQSLSEIQSLKTKLTQSESSLTKANERNEVLETEKAGLAEENFLLVEENESLNAKIDALKAENESLKQHEKEASFSDSEEEKCDGYHEVRAKMGNWDDWYPNAWIASIVDLGLSVDGWWYLLCFE